MQKETLNWGLSHAFYEAIFHLAGWSSAGDLLGVKDIPYGLLSSPETKGGIYSMQIHVAPVHGNSIKLSTQTTRSEE